MALPEQRRSRADSVKKASEPLASGILVHPRTLPPLMLDPG